MVKQRFRNRIYKDLVEHIIENAFDDARKIAKRKRINNFRIIFGEFSFKSVPCEANDEKYHPPGVTGLSAWEWKLEFSAWGTIGDKRESFNLRGHTLKGTVSADNGTGGYDYSSMEV